MYVIKELTYVTNFWVERLIQIIVKFLVCTQEALA